jgi:hypothetical protein
VSCRMDHVVKHNNPLLINYSIWVIFSSTRFFFFDKFLLVYSTGCTTLNGGHLTSESLFGLFIYYYYFFFGVKWRRIVDYEQTILFGLFDNYQTANWPENSLWPTAKKTNTSFVSYSGTTHFPLEYFSKFGFSFHFFLRKK